MDTKEKIGKLDQLTFETEMLFAVMHDVLTANEEKNGISKLCYLSEIICQKFREIRALF